MNKSSFSERNEYGPKKVLIREQMPIEVANSIYNLFIRVVSANTVLREDLDTKVGMDFFNLKIYELWDPYYVKNGLVYIKEFVEDYFLANENIWYKKIDLLEFCLNFLQNKNWALLNNSIDSLNNAFERLSWAYRIINNLVIEITSEGEIKSIEKTLASEDENIKMHMKKALRLYSLRPNADYANSIKESISAVEVKCRLLTGEKTLGKALDALESKGGVNVPKMLKEAFSKIYAYTNGPGGMRHGDPGKDIPTDAEALYMLVTCSAFLNYLDKKKANSNS